MKEEPIEIPYPGAKEHYILDIENYQLSQKAISILEPITPLPKSKKKNKFLSEQYFLTAVIYIILY